MKTLTVLIAVLIVAFLFALIGGYTWMICLGVLSHIFDVPSLAISYWQSVVVAFIANLLLGGFSRTRD